MNATMNDEFWLTIDRANKDGGSQKRTIKAISNKGNLMRTSGKIEPLSYRKKVYFNGKCHRAYRLIADYFLVTVKRPDQTSIDHISHSPEGMNINDVRNLRWCNQKENCNFDEALENMSKASKEREMKRKASPL